MKTPAIILFCTAISASSVYSQDAEEMWFDFWVGDWEVNWDEANGGKGKGTNTITKILDNKVIRENFRAEEGSLKGYLGTSLSVYNPKGRTWHQGYADNQGAYFNFSGERQGNRRMFKTEAVTRGDKKIIQRMVFYDIREDSLMWDWESSEDGGKTWALIWRIEYRRRS